MSHSIWSWSCSVPGSNSIEREGVFCRWLSICCVWGSFLPGWRKLANREVSDCVSTRAGAYLGGTPSVQRACTLWRWKMCENALLGVIIFPIFWAPLYIVMVHIRVFCFFQDTQDLHNMFEKDCFSCEQFGYVCLRRGRMDEFVLLWAFFFSRRVMYLLRCRREDNLIGGSCLCCGKEGVFESILGILLDLLLSRSTVSYISECLSKLKRRLAEWGFKKVISPYPKRFIRLSWAVWTAMLHTASTVLPWPLFEHAPSAAFNN